MNGMIPLGLWMAEKATARGIRPAAMYDRCRAAGIWPKMHRVNARNILCEPDDVSLPTDPRPGEVPLKQYLAERGAKLGVGRRQMQRRLERAGALKEANLRRVNARVIFVKEAA